MPIAVQAVVTNAWRTKIARIYAGLDSFSLPLSFKIAEGGWQTVGSDKVPIAPSPTLTDVTALSYPVGSQYIFTKNLLSTDLTFVSPTRLQINCFVATSEANNDGFGSPNFYELGVFNGSSGGGTMILYSTFPLEIKTSVLALTHTLFVDIVSSS